MSFMYINPGYGELVNSDYFETVRNNFTYSPLNGTSFTRKTAGTANFTVNKSADTFFAKFIWWQGSAQIVAAIQIPVRAYYTSSSFSAYTFLINLCSNSLNWGYTYKISSTKVRTKNVKWTRNAAVGDVNSFYIAIPNNNTITMVYNGVASTTNLFHSGSAVTIFNTGTVSFNFDPNFSSALSDENKTYFSEFIVSDTEFPPDARAVILPSGDVDTTMKKNDDGLYIPNKTTPKWMMTPSTASPLDTFNDTAKVYGLGVGASPCEVAAASSAKFHILSKSGDTTTEHVSVTATSATKAFSSAWIPESETTVADLQNMQLGFKAGD